MDAGKWQIGYPVSTNLVAWFEICRNSLLSTSIIASIFRKIKPSDFNLHLTVPSSKETKGFVMPCIAMALTKQLEATNHPCDSGTLLYNVIMMSPDQQRSCAGACLSTMTDKCRKPNFRVLVQVPHVWGGPCEQVHHEPILKIKWSNWNTSIR